MRNSTEYIDLNEYDDPNNATQSRSSIHTSNILDQSMTGAGISNLIKDTTRRQKRNESKILERVKRNSKVTLDRDKSQ